MIEIKNCISFLAGKAAQTISRVTRERLEKHEITPLQYAVLQWLWEKGDCSSAEIGSSLILDSATVTGVIDRLERSYLVKRIRDPSDRRVNRIHLTDAARDRMITIQRESETINNDFDTYLGVDAQLARQILRKLANFEK